MIVVEHNYSVNFIDKNDIFFGYEMSTSCCEYPGWFVTYQKPVNNLNVDMAVENCLSRNKVDLSDYVLVPGSFKVLNEVVFAKATHPSKKAIYACVFNIQNGYYSHEYLLGSGIAGIYDKFISAGDSHCKRRWLYSLDAINDDGTQPRFGPWPKPVSVRNKGMI